jgi:hypothetical protein
MLLELPGNAAEMSLTFRYAPIINQRLLVSCLDACDTLLCALLCLSMASDAVCPTVRAVLQSVEKASLLIV